MRLSSIFNVPLSLNKKQFDTQMSQDFGKFFAFVVLHKMEGENLCKVTGIRDINLAALE
jgi:hypothetical protein